MKSVYYKKQGKKELEACLLETRLQHILTDVIMDRIPLLQTDIKTLTKYGIVVDDNLNFRYDKGMLQAQPLKTLVQIYDITRNRKKEQWK